MPDRLDVHRNPGRSRRVVPFLLVVQSNRFRASTRRVIVPLIVASEFGQGDNDVGPHFVIEGQDVVLDPLQITNVSRDVPGPVVVSLADEDTRIVNALDAMLSRAWR